MPLTGRRITYIVENGDQVAQDVCQQMQAVRRLGAHVTVYCLSGSGKALTPGQEYERLEPLDERAAPLPAMRRLRAIARLREHLRQDASEILICEQYRSITTAVLATVVPGTRRRHIIALIRGFHAARSRSRRRFYRLFASRIDGFIALTQSHQEHLREMMPWFDAARFHVVNIYLDTRRMRAQMLPARDARGALGIGDGPFTFGVVSRFDSTKRLTDLVAAAAILHGRGYDFRVVVIGDGRERDAIERQIRDLHLEQRFTLTGSIADAVVYLRALDAFVFPSEGDSFGRVILEAYAARLPVIGVNQGGTPEVLGPHGILSQARNPDDLALKMEQVMGMPSGARARLGRQAAEWSASRFSSETIERQLASALEAY